MASSTPRARPKRKVAPVFYGPDEGSDITPLSSKQVTSDVDYTIGDEEEEEEEEDTPVSKPDQLKLLYLGKLPVDAAGLGIVPTINDISWNRHAKTTKRKMILAYTGSLGTYTFSRNLPKDSVGENIKEKWTKVQLSTDIGTLCKWCPAEGNILAISFLNEENKGVVKLFDTKTKTSAEFFTGFGGYGMNSLSWNREGNWLLCTYNESRTFAVVKRTRRGINRKQFKLKKYKSKLEEKPDLLGVFLSTLPYLFVASTAGEIRTYFYLEGDQGATDDWQCRNYYSTYEETWAVSPRLCAISAAPDEQTLICIRSNGDALLLKINYDILIDNTRLSGIFSAATVVHPTHSQLPDVSLSWNDTLLATIDMTELLKVHLVSDSEFEEQCDNKTDIDCTKRSSQLNALDCHEDVFATGGVNGIINFWGQRRTRGVYKFAERERDIYSEELFYRKEKLEIGTEAQVEKFDKVQRRFDKVQKEFTEAAAAAKEKLDLVQGQMKKGASLARSVLKRIHQGQTLSPEETRKFAQGVLEALTTID